VTDERRFYEAPALGAQRSAPAALRNREPIAQVVAEWLPARGLVLEVASGTGEHAVYFAERFFPVEWQPTDVHREALASIRLGARRPAFETFASRSSSTPQQMTGRSIGRLLCSASTWSTSARGHRQLGLVAGSARLLPRRRAR
jgi:hypothetical protein